MKSLVILLIFRIIKILIYLLVGTMLLVLSLRFIDPPYSAFMIGKKFMAHWENHAATQIKQHWINWEKLPKSFVLAVIAAEDQNFFVHWGFDLEAIQKAYQHNLSKKKIKGASTLSQQVAKNLFLWSGKSYFRKGLEAYFTILIELFWSKQRILEIYCNIAELGELTFGVEEASIYYFKKSSTTLTNEQAAMLAALLPNPLRYGPNRQGRYVQTRKNWIMNQMSALGGTALFYPTN